MKEDVFHLGAKALIINHVGEILVLKQNPKKRSGLNPLNYWDLPGGRLKKGDNLKNALLREAKEEIGIKDLEIREFFDASIASVRVKSGKDIFRLILFTYLCSIKDPSKVKLIDDEHIQFNWVSPKKAAELLRIKFGDSFAQKISNL